MLILTFFLKLLFTEPLPVLNFKKETETLKKVRISIRIHFFDHVNEQVVVVGSSSSSR